MRRDTFKKINSSFLSCDKDAETIINKLFVEYKPYADVLKRLLVINTRDCLDDLENPEYIKKIESMSVSKLKENGYIRFVPEILFPEWEETKSYLIITFDNFSPNMTNPEFRDCMVHIDILCNPEQVDLGDYRMRYFKIAGYIDGLLNNQRLSGIGTLHFAGFNKLVLGSMSGYTLSYAAIHGEGDDSQTEGVVNNNVFKRTSTDN